MVIDGINNSVSVDQASSLGKNSFNVSQNKNSSTEVMEKMGNINCLHDSQSTSNTQRSVENTTNHDGKIESNLQTSAKTDVNETAKKIANTLAGNLDAIADKFIGDEAVCKTITSNFTSLIGQLKGALGKLTAEGTYGDKTGVAKGLVTLNSFLERYDSTGVGGFNRTSEFFKAEEGTPLGVIQTAKNATGKLEKKLDSLKDNTSFQNLLDKGGMKLEDLKKGVSLEKLQGALNGNTDEELLELNKLAKEKLDADGEKNAIKVSDLRDQISKRLDQLTGAKLAEDSKERMLNLSQQISLGAWIFNDIIDGFGKENKGCFKELEEKLKDIKALNTKARNTPMFSEIKLDGKNWDAFVNEVSTEDAEKLTKLKNYKLGLRGRSSYGQKTFKVETQPLYNLKADYDQDGKEKNEGIIKGDIPALKGGFAPKPTARHDALPKELITVLTNNKNKPGCQTIIDELVDKGVLIKKEVDGKLVSLESAPSFAAIIDDVGFPTYCSVSGTTGELVSTLVYMLDDPAKKELDDTLDALLNLAEGAKFEAVNKKDFSTFFAPIATFMEVGHFHTTAEVLGGFYSVAVAKNLEEGKNIAADTMATGFETLLGILKGHPEAFLG